MPIWIRKILNNTMEFFRKCPIRTYISVSSGVYSKFGGCPTNYLTVKCSHEIANQQLSREICWKLLVCWVVYLAMILTNICSNRSNWSGIGCYYSRRWLIGVVPLSKWHEINGFLRNPPSPQKKPQQTNAHTHTQTYTHSNYNLAIEHYVEDHAI